MSANNFVLIREHATGPRFVVSDQCVESDGGFQIGTAETLEEAIQIANTYMNVEIVEYGIKVQLLDK